MSDDRLDGVFQGFVRDNKDPEGRGRIRCFCPEVMGAEDDPDHWLGWAEGCFPWLGGLSTLDMGVPPTPAENDGEPVPVWLIFRRGEVDFPLWIGVGVYAPTKDGVHSQIDHTSFSVQPGGSIVGQAAGDTDAINPVKLAPSKEVRLIVKAGTDIVIASDRGGSVIIGPSGVNFVAPVVRVNGRTLDASLERMFG